MEVTKVLNRWNFDLVSKKTSVLFVDILRSKIRNGIKTKTPISKCR